MITVIDGNTLMGKKDDTKPTDAQNAMKFVEFDTGKVYFFDEETKEWIDSDDWGE